MQPELGIGPLEQGLLPEVVEVELEDVVCCVVVVEEEVVEDVEDDEVPPPTAEQSPPWHIALWHSLLEMQVSPLAFV